MRDDDHPEPVFLLQNLLYGVIRDQVQRVRSLIRDQHVRIAQQGAGQGDFLAVALRQPGNEFTDRAVMALLQRGDEFISLCGPRGCGHILKAGTKAVIPVSTTSMTECTGEIATSDTEGTRLVMTCPISEITTNSASQARPLSVVMMLSILPGVGSPTSTIS